MRSRRRLPAALLLPALLLVLVALTVATAAGARGRQHSRAAAYLYNAGHSQWWSAASVVDARVLRVALVSAESGRACLVHGDATAHLATESSVVTPAAYGYDVARLSAQQQALGALTNAGAYGYDGAPRSLVRASGKPSCGYDGFERGAGTTRAPPEVALAAEDGTMAGVRATGQEGRGRLWRVSIRARRCGFRRRRARPRIEFLML